MTGTVLPRRAHAPALLISLPDIARLTQVQRPVVSMWRTRAMATSTPFPAAIGREQGQEWFDLDDGGSWLRATDRGNNADFALDAPAFASVAGHTARGGETVWRGLTALLTLCALTSEPLDGADEHGILDLADDEDPDDEFLVTEIAALGHEMVPLAHHAQMMSSAAHSPVAAFERLMSDRFRLHMSAYVSTSLQPAAVQFAISTARALAAVNGWRTPTFVDPTAGGSDLLVALADSAPTLQTVFTAQDGSAEGRLARRRLAMHDISARPLATDELGMFELPASSVLLAQYPHPGAPAMSDTAVLAAIEALVVKLEPDHVGIVVGPGDALIDEPRAVDAADRPLTVRGDILRSGRVRAIVRLPAGLVVSRPRQQLAAWVLGPAHASTADAADVVAADLSDSDFTGGAMTP